MQRLILLFFSLFLFGYLTGQPTITSEILPSVGDTFLMASDNLPEGVAILGKGEDQAWDFMSLQSAFTQKVAVQPAINARNKPTFLTADVMIQEMGGIHNFYKSDGQSLQLLGSIGLDPLNMGVQTITYFERPLSTLHFPLNYGSTSTNEGNFSFKVAANELPKEILFAFPITPDSIRYRGYITQKNEVDAWGTLALPDNTYEVLREKQIEEKIYEVDIKVGNLPWQDITESIEDPRILNKQISQSYHFYSNETTSKVAIANMKPNGVNPENVIYTVTDPSSTMRKSTGRPDIYAYPNPAIQDVRFEFSNLKPSTYSLKIYNILGVIVMQENYKLNGFKTIKLDVSRLRKGTYLYSLSDAKGKTIATRRLMVIRP